MVRFKGHDLYLNDGDQIYFSDDVEAAIWFESGELYLNSTISGVDPIKSYHLATKYYVDTTASICQVYDNSGITDCNSGVVFPFDGESFKDLNYTHSNTINPERVVVNSSGIYKVHYNISHINQTSSRKNIRTFCVINDSVMINPSLSYAYSRNTIDKWATNSASFFVLLNEGDYITLVCEQAGSAGFAISEAEGCWLMMEKVRNN